MSAFIFQCDSGLDVTKPELKELIDICRKQTKILRAVHNISKNNSSELFDESLPEEIKNFLETAQKDYAEIEAKRSELQPSYTPNPDVLLAMFIIGVDKHLARMAKNFISDFSEFSTSEKDDYYINFHSDAPTNRVFHKIKRKLKGEGIAKEFDRFNFLINKKNFLYFGNDNAPYREAVFAAINLLENTTGIKLNDAYQLKQSVSAWSSINCAKNLQTSGKKMIDVKDLSFSMFFGVQDPGLTSYLKTNIFKEQKFSEIRTLTGEKIELPYYDKENLEEKQPVIIDIVAAMALLETNPNHKNKALEKSQNYLRSIDDSGIFCSNRKPGVIQCLSWLTSPELLKTASNNIIEGNIQSKFEETLKDFIAIIPIIYDGTDNAPKDKFIKAVSCYWEAVQQDIIEKFKENASPYHGCEPSA